MLGNNSQEPENKQENSQEPGAAVQALREEGSLIQCGTTLNSEHVLVMTVWLMLI